MCTQGEWAKETLLDYALFTLFVLNSACVLTHLVVTTWGQ